MESRDGGAADVEAVESDRGEAGGRERDSDSGRVNETYRFLPIVRKVARTNALTRSASATLGTHT